MAWTTPLVGTTEYGKTKYTERYPHIIQSHFPSRSCRVLSEFPNYVWFPGTVPVHLCTSSCSLFTAFLSRSSFMHVSRNIVSIDGSISSSGMSLLPEVEASTKLFFASMKFSLAHSKSNYGSFVGALQTQVLSLHCLPLLSPIVIPLRSTIFTIGSSSRGPNLIICKF